MEIVNSTAQAGADSVTPIYEVDWSEFELACGKVMARQEHRPESVYGPPMGGSVVASYISGAWDVPQVSAPRRDTLVVDDLVDSGATLRPWAEKGFAVDALFRKPASPRDLAPEATEVPGWIKFPWEVHRDPRDSVTRVLEWLGEDPNREGLRDTPERYVKAMREMVGGYKQDPARILSRTFDERSDEMVIVRGIEFHSLCEHHLLPFHGVAHVAYIPKGRVVGLSKIPRLVNCFARRLQIQERLTRQIAQALMDCLDPAGAACIIRAHHTCMSMRGVKCHADMITSSLLGGFRGRARDEFLRLCEANHG